MLKGKKGKGMEKKKKRFVGEHFQTWIKCKLVLLSDSDTNHIGNYLLFNHLWALKSHQILKYLGNMRSFHWKYTFI